MPVDDNPQSMADTVRWRLVGGLCVCLLLAGCLGVVTSPDDSDYDWKTVTAVDDETGDELATVEVRIADNRSLRYTGLSDTDALGENEGMLFIHDSEGEPGYVMRDMAFSIDIVFIDSTGEITTIHHADADDDETFRGTAQYVLEVPYHYTTDNDIAVGDRIEIPEEYQ